MLRLVLAVGLAVAVPVAAVAAPDQSVAWRRYERTPRADGTPSACLAHRHGAQAVGAERVFVFQILNDCGRPTRATCDIAYTPTCSYGADVEPAGHFEGVIEPHGEGSVFGSFSVRAPGKVAGCFFARCSEAGASAEATPQVVAGR